MLISMLVSHLGKSLPVGPTSSLVYKTAMLTDAASAFVFLSGLTVGLVYLEGWLEPALRHRRSAVTRRAWTIFTYHAVLVVGVTLLATFAQSSGQHHWLFDAYGSAPLLFGALSVLMLAGGWCLDILPMYVLFLFLSPAALSAIASRKRWIVALAAGLAWIVGQTGLLEYAWDSAEVGFGLNHQHIDLGLDFNRLSWSALYFSGLLFGSAYTQGQLDLSRLRHPRFVPAMLASTATIALSMLLLVAYLGSIISEQFALFYWLANKSTLGLLALLNFFSALFMVTWLIVAGPSSAMASMRWLGNGVTRIVLARPLVLLGEHSLPVFAFHIAGIYLFYWLVDTSRLDAWTANAILLLGVLSLFIPAYAAQYLKSRRKRPQEAELATT